MGGEAREVRSRTRVLLAEDNPVNQLVLVGQLESLGARVEVVENGRQAVERVRERRFDLVLMDCQMPVLDGYRATREIRRWEEQRWEQQGERESRGGARSSGAHLPVVAVTAHALEGEREKCLEAGMDDYLVKPFQLEQLEEILARWLPRESTLEGPRESPDGRGGEPTPGGADGD